MGDTPAIRQHLGKTYYIPASRLAQIRCHAGDYTTPALPISEARLNFRQHRKDAGDTVAPLRFRVTYHVGDTVLVPLGLHRTGHAQGVISQLTMTRVRASAHVLAHLGDSTPSLREYPLSSLELEACPHKGWTEGLGTWRLIP